MTVQPFPYGVNSNELLQENNDFVHKNIDFDWKFLYTLEEQKFTY